MEVTTEWVYCHLQRAENLLKVHTGIWTEPSTYTYITAMKALLWHFHLSVPIVFWNMKLLGDFGPRVQCDLSWKDPLLLSYQDSVHNMKYEARVYNVCYNC